MGKSWRMIAVGLAGLTAVAAISISAVGADRSGVAPGSARATTAGSAEPALPPADGPLDPTRIDSMLARAAQMRPLSSLLVWHRGELVVEQYYRGMSANRAVNLKSVSKTLLSPLVGIAIRDGLIEGVDQPLRELLPGYYSRLDRSSADDPRKDAISLRHLMDMTSGLQTTSFGNYGGWVASSDWGWDQLRRPLECPPGRCFEYTTGGTHLIGLALTRASGRTLRRYFRDVLFGPLGIDLPGWDRDPQGNYLGGNNMALRPADLLAVGVLYLEDGQHEGEQILPPDWIESTWRPKFRSPWNGHGYGGLWWSERWAGETARFAWGYGGQYLVIVPRLDLVIVATSSLDRRERGHTRSMRRFFDRYAVPAFQPT